MKSKVAKTVLDMGYDPRLVRAVFRRRIENSQSPFTNAQDLLEAIFDAEGNIELEDEPAPGDVPAGDDKSSQLAKDLQNMTLVEDPSKGSEGAGELSSHASAGMIQNICLWCMMFFVVGKCIFVVCWCGWGCVVYFSQNVGSL